MKLSLIATLSLCAACGGTPFALEASHGGSQDGSAADGEALGEDASTDSAGNASDGGTSDAGSKLDAAKSDGGSESGVSADSGANGSDSSALNLCCFVCFHPGPATVELCNPGANVTCSKLGSWCEIGSDGSGYGSVDNCSASENCL
jgi:hypothetical protein